MLQRTFVHDNVMPDPGEEPLHLGRFEPTPTLVLKMGARVWWITEPNGTPVPVNPRNVRVCMAVNCSVDGCTRAKSLEPFKADISTNRELAAGKLAEAELSAIVEFVFTEFPSERTPMATHGTAATVQGLLRRFRRVTEAAGLTIEGTPEPDGHATYLTMLRKEGQIRDPEQVKADRLANDHAWVDRQPKATSLPRKPHESAEQQIDRLADFILAEIPGEPSQNEGAIDTAIRVLRQREAQASSFRHIKAFVEQEFPAELAAGAIGGPVVEKVTRLLERYKRLRAVLRARAMQHGEPWTSFVDSLGNTPIGPLV